MLKKRHIVITGPESSGKSTLSVELAKTFQATLVPEFARQYLIDRNGEYTREDLRKIAFGQFRSQLSAMATPASTVISDTCLLTILIWDEWKYRQSDDFVLEWSGLQQVDYYLVCKPDLPWEIDPLRESEVDRDALFEIYLRYVKETGVPYDIIEGYGPERTTSAEAMLSSFLSENN